MRFLIGSAALLAALAAAVAPSGAQSSDLDAFMKQVLTRRDDNWKKLQQYTLEEDETFQVSALNGRKLYGFRREYSWYPSTSPETSPSTSPDSQGAIFIRSPISADGVTVSEDDRREAEAEWLRREEGREKARQAREDKRAAEAQDSGEPAPELEDLVKPGNEPRFVSSAYFMKFKFDQGSYALAGREKLLGRDVLKIEYYPRRFFQDERKRNEQDTRKSQKEKDLEEKVERKMDKVSMITMWIEPKDHQILQYEFSNIDFDFLPGRSLMRLDELRALMRMREAFPDVWLPDTIAMSFGLTLAVGEVAARYDVKYHDYKLAEVKARVR